MLLSISGGIIVFGIIWWLSPPDFTNFEIRIVWTSLKFLGFLMISQLNAWTNIELLRSMYAHRRYEFRKHARSQIVLTIITQLCIYYLLIRTLIDFFVFYCINFNEQVLGPDTDFEDGCICHRVDKISGGLHNDDIFSMFTYLTEIVSDVSLVTSFFVLKTPHDCFECLSIDPNLTISTF